MHTYLSLCSMLPPQSPPFLFSHWHLSVCPSFCVLPLLLLVSFCVLHTLSLSLSMSLSVCLSLSLCPFLCDPPQFPHLSLYIYIYTLSVYSFFPYPFSGGHRLIISLVCSILLSPSSLLPSFCCFSLLISVLPLAVGTIDMDMMDKKNRFGGKIKEAELEFEALLTLKVLVATIDALGHFETG